MTFNWSRDKIPSQLLWRHIGESDDDDESTVFFVDKLDAEDYFDIVASYSITENYRVSFGIDNVADKKPPVLGDNEEQANTWPATYDVFGRTYYVKETATFESTIEKVVSISGGPRPAVFFALYCRPAICCTIC